MGQDLRGAALIDRKRVLEALLDNARGAQLIKYVEHIEGDGELVLDHVCKLGLEGIVSKRADHRPIGRQAPGLDQDQVRGLARGEPRSVREDGERAMILQITVPHERDCRIDMQKAVVKPLSLRSKLGQDTNGPFPIVATKHFLGKQLADCSRACLDRSDVSGDPITLREHGLFHAALYAALGATRCHRCTIVSSLDQDEDGDVASGQSRAVQAVREGVTNPARCDRA